MKNLKWFVAYTYSKAEKKVSTQIQNFGVEVFLPLKKEKKQWSDRIKWQEIPLFPSYIFVKTTEENIANLQEVSGLVKFLSFRGEWAVVQEEEINVIKKILSERACLCRPENFLKRGERVKIRDGSLKGIEGILIKEDGKKRFVIKINTLKQALSLSVPTDYLQSV